MKHDIMINLHVDNKAIAALIKGLQGILNAKGKEVFQPYSGKKAKEIRYMKCGFELAMYQVKTSEGVIITFYNTDSEK
jgi:hypothetical protein